MSGWLLVAIGEESKRWEQLVLVLLRLCDRGARNRWCRYIRRREEEAQASAETQASGTGICWHQLCRRWGTPPFFSPSSSFGQMLVDHDASAELRTRWGTSRWVPMLLHHWGALSLRLQQSCNSAATERVSVESHLLLQNFVETQKKKTQNLKCTKKMCRSVTLVCV